MIKNRTKKAVTAAASQHSAWVKARDVRSNATEGSGAVQGATASGADGNPPQTDNVFFLSGFRLLVMFALAEIST